MEMEDRQFRDFMNDYLRQASLVMEKVMIFIDGGYWRRCLEDYFHRADVDLSMVIPRLVKGRRLVRTYFYTARIENPQGDYWRTAQQEQQRFLAALSRQPSIEVRFGKLQFPGGNTPPRQKGVDVLLALDMLRFALKDNYDTAILVSGDGDFANIVRMVKDEGRKLEIVTFPGTLSRQLMEECDENTEVTPELLEGCWLESEGSEPST